MCVHLKKNADSYLCVLNNALWIDEVLIYSLYFPSSRKYISGGQCRFPTLFFMRISPVRISARAVSMYGSTSVTGDPNTSLALANFSLQFGYCINYVQGCLNVYIFIKTR